ncbi:MAG: hypothetical protein D4R84_11735 [Rhodocyclaceae bacterium]|nr:MAG: hypothetical protein D4R84_11735 [Rhodocyclaceae bacterium]
MRVRLDAQMMRRFAGVAADRGMAPSTLAAFVLAEYTCEQERTVIIHQIEREDGVIIGKSKR